MVSLDRTNVFLIPHNILSPIMESLSIDAQKEFKHLRNQTSKAAKERFLSHFMVDQYQKITMQREINLKALLHLPPPTTISKSDDIQSLRHY